MLTGIRVLKTCAFILFLLTALSARCQTTANIRPFERYWTKPRLVPKAGLGIQETAFIEAGVQWHKIYVHPLALASAGPYFTVDGMIRDEEPLIGPKIGYEITAGLIGIAADATWYTDFKRESVMVTPKAGLSLLGFADLFYGFNINLSDVSFHGVSKNRLSLVLNINRDYFNLRAAGKKPVRVSK